MQAVTNVLETQRFVLGPEVGATGNGNFRLPGLPLRRELRIRN